MVIKPHSSFNHPADKRGDNNGRRQRELRSITQATNVSLHHNDHNSRKYNYPLTEQQQTHGEAFSIVGIETTYLQVLYETLHEGNEVLCCSNVAWYSLCERRRIMTACHRTVTSTLTKHGYAHRTGMHSL